MEKTRITAIVMAALIVAIALQGCTPERKGSSNGKPSVSLPIAGGKVWRDTTVEKNVKGVGTFTVAIRGGQISITSPAGLNTLKWSITSVHKDNSKQASQKKKSAALSTGGGGDYDHDGVPDCEDWCITIPGPPENHGCPPEVDGVPPIRWIELMSLSEGVDTLLLEYGIEGCEGQ